MSESTSLMDLVGRLIANPAAIALDLSAPSQEQASASSLLLIVTIGFALHGIVLGSCRPGIQTFSAMIKVPLVPILSLIITIPLLHAFALGASGGGSLRQTLAVALVPLAVTSILLAAASPLLLFFGATSDYHFTKLLHVAATGLFALWGVVSLLSVLKGLGGYGRGVFLPWVLAYFFVAAQMAWTLRPFIGAPDRPFRWLGGRDAKLGFYTAVALSLSALSRGEATPPADQRP